MADLRAKRGRPPLQTGRKDHIIPVRFDGALYEMLCRIAERRRLPVSETIRRILAGRLSDEFSAYEKSKPATPVAS